MAWLKKQSIRFWWRSGIPDHDPNPCFLNPGHLEPDHGIYREFSLFTIAILSQD